MVAKKTAVADVEVREALDVTAAEPAAVEDTAATKTSITVKFRDHLGQPTERTFSKDVHGKDFKALAEEFTTTNASRIIKD